MTTRRRLLLPALVTLALLAACGQVPGGQAAPEARAPTPDLEGTGAPDGAAQPPPVEPQPGAGALPAGLDVTLPAVGGGQVVGAELAGRHLALWFWAPW